MTSKKPQTVIPIEDYKVAMKQPHHSEFDDDMKRIKDYEDEMAQFKAVTIDDDEPDIEKDDEYRNQRLHCWILLQKGKREIQETFFIEPTTGRRYAVNDSPYLSV